ncbi:nucleotidyltransferase domain-containing protein [Bacillus sp. UMB0893]|uniref:nucleotidyltransferase domain-containing protein n=1 Tax=Bacillus sp. UMB0893 TaxID=2066053 RepID=UPI000C7932D7|nr:nucleotidyltransferase domain-containing protein [Bacillus sp. UMB0893]PLR66220.1 nucleotidyltransferase domain-containing protein [Bacillus sp. UMB0893]QNG58270.1 nucleotidyltransferase domain-containing protein [Bacillus sp. PAMC26568]
MRLEPFEAAKKIIEKRFPKCQAAVLSGSVVRGEATPASDLDIVIFDETLKASYRESFVEFGWPVEAFVHNFDSYRHFFESDCKSGTPSMPRMVYEGIVLRGKLLLEPIKEEAERLLEKGPDPWSKEEIDLKRYFITDALDDFIGSRSRSEMLFITNSLAELLHEFVLRTNGRYIGKSKWIPRALMQFDPKFAEEFTSVFDEFYRTGKKENIIILTDSVLKPFGGRFFEGFSIGKNE